MFWLDLMKLPIYRFLWREFFQENTPGIDIFSTTFNVLKFRILQKIVLLYDTIELMTFSIMNIYT